MVINALPGLYQPQNLALLGVGLGFQGVPVGVSEIKRQQQQVRQVPGNNSAMRRLPPVEELVAAQGNIVLKTFSVEDKGPQGNGVDIL